MVKAAFSILFLLLICPDAFAGLTLIQHVGNFSTSTNTVTVTVSATGSGNLLVAGVAAPILSVVSVSDGINNFIHFPNAQGLSPYPIDVWYLPRSTAGRTTITMTINAVAGELELEVWEVSGFKNPIPDGGGAVNNGSTSGGSDTGAAVTTSASKGFLVGIDPNNGAITANPKAGNPFNAGGDLIDGDAYCSAISTATGSYQPVWSDSNPAAQFTSSTAAFRDVGAAAFGGTVRLGKARIGY